MEQPAGSRIIVTHPADSLVLSQPRKGFLSWGGCCTLLTGVWIAPSLWGLTVSLSDEWPIILSASIFVAVGMAFLLMAIHAWAHTWSFERSRDSLAFTQRGVLGRRVRQWPILEVSSLWVEEADWSDPPYYLLNLGFRNGRRETLLKGASREEFQWMAESLSGVKGKLRRSPRPDHDLGRLRVDSGIGECQVCGERMSSRTVYCAKCRTPHHEECWEYTGVCSTFACREIRFTRDGVH